MNGLMRRSKTGPYSITSLAWASSVAGTVRPSVLAGVGPEHIKGDRQWYAG